MKLLTTGLDPLSHEIRLISHVLPNNSRNRLNAYDEQEIGKCILPLSKSKKLIGGGLSMSVEQISGAYDICRYLHKLLGAWIHIENSTSNRAFVSLL